MYSSKNNSPLCIVPLLQILKYIIICLPHSIKYNLFALCYKKNACNYNLKFNNLEP